MTMKAAEIMTTEVAKIKGSETVAKAVQLMREKNIRTLIVDRRHDEDAYGIITETDIVYKVVAFGQDPQKVRVYEVMSKPCIVINPDLGVEYVARLFANTGIRFAPVIKGGLLGVISVSDIPECLTQVSETLEIAWKEKKVAGYGMLRLTEHQRTSHVNHYQSLCSTTFFTVSTQPMARPATPQGISLDGHSSNL
ncbi:MAG: CBS domain-containing protein [Microcystis aeruginosa]